jgi:hypothetical protein
MADSELFGAVPEGMPKNDIMKSDFGWEVPIEAIPLPSKGTVYSPDSQLYNRETVHVKAMTAREEDILTSQAYIKDGTVLTELIRSCMTDKSVDPDDLINGDRVALMIGIRVTGYGPEYKASATCSSCSKRNDIITDLGALQIKRLGIKPVKEGKNAFEFKLPVTKKTVIFKFLTNNDEKEREVIAKNQAKILKTKTNNSVTSFLEHSILSIDGKSDKLKIKHFVQNMPAFDSKALRQHISDSEPGMDMKWSFNCSECSADSETNLPITAEFFWPTK